MAKIEGILLKKFGEDYQTREAVNDVKFQISYDDLRRFQFHTDYNYQEMIFSEKYLFTTYQKIGMMISQNRLLIFLMLFVIVGSTYYVHQLRLRKKYEEFALPIYKGILEKVIAKTMVPCDELNTRISTFPVEDRERIKAEFERIRVQDEQLTTFCQRGIMYWVYV